MEKELTLFKLALGLESPWKINAVNFKEQEGKRILDLNIGYQKGVKFTYEGQEYSVYDHVERSWRHLNFFQHECFLHARVPRVKLEDGKVKTIEVPWAAPGSSFTLLFEDYVVDLMKGEMSASGVGRLMAIGDKTVFRIINRRVSHALATQYLAPVQELSIDETSSKKGHNYFTIFGDRTAKKVVGISSGKDKEAFAQALIDMEVRGAGREEVKAVTMDMSRSFIAGVNEWMDQADIVFDRFHLSQSLNKSIDAIRRTEQREFKELKNSRYLWLKRSENLNEEQTQKVEYLAKAFPTIGEAYRLKELFKTILDQAQIDKNTTALEAWMDEAWESGIQPIMKFIEMLCNHWYGIESYFRRLSTNAFAERVNLKIQDIKRTAKGYRNVQNFMTMIYFHLGGLDLKTHSN